VKERSPEEFLSSFRARPAASMLFLDFDGTLSEIAPVPEGARLHPVAGRELARLASLYPVCMVSGRPAEELAGLVEVEGISCFIGLHGLERMEGGSREVLEGAEPFLEVMSTARRELEAEMQKGGLGERDGVYLEDKGLILALHFRRDPSCAGAAEEAARRVAGRQRLALHCGRMVVELRPPVSFGKGRAVEGQLRLHGGERALYMGDDLTDVDAFRALRRLEGDIEGFSSLCVAVASPESPGELLVECDLAVTGVDGAVDLLTRL
jgi:trehalose 6-phosphate phosphatase